MSPTQLEMMAVEVPLTKAHALAALFAALAIGIGSCAGVRVGRSCDLREPAADSIGAASPPAIVEPGDRYVHIATQGLPAADFRALTSDAGRRTSR